jgi:asparagine synthase (glutamine-hydrolysing)
MRLIAGIFRFDGAEASAAQAHAMLDALDEPHLRTVRRIWLRGPVALAVLDADSGASAAPLPESGGRVIAADVRLDEPDTLGRALSAGASASDEQLLGAALDAWGADGLREVLGDFAFAHWNAAAQRLTCGRDIFGVRPFAYAQQPGRCFAFASFPIALLGAGFAPKRIDEDALARRMMEAHRFDDSLMAGVNRLAPAHVIEVTRSGVAIKRYWRLERAAVGARDVTPSEAARTVGELVERAVRRRLPRDGEAGAHLSGGLDSSAVAVLAARRLRAAGRRLHAYAFQDRPRNDVDLEDESLLAGSVAEQEGDIELTFVPPSGRPGVLKPLDPDQMTSVDGGRPDAAVCEAAAAQGVSLILSGWGGDEAVSFNGRGLFPELLARGRWRTMARELRAVAHARGLSPGQVARSELLAYLLPRSFQTVARKVAGKAVADAETLFAASLRPSVRQRRAVRTGRALRLAADGRENRWRMINSPHIAGRLEDWARLGARHGVAFAFPLLDRDVVEFALSLPSELFVREGFRRRVFRDAMAGVLPDTVRQRHQKRQPFPAHWLRVAGAKEELLARLDGYQSREEVARFIDLRQLRQWIEAFPSIDECREALAAGRAPRQAQEMTAALRALAFAEYLVQHGGGAASAFTLP